MYPKNTSEECIECYHYIHRCLLWDLWNSYYSRCILSLMRHAYNLMSIQVEFNEGDLIVLINWMKWGPSNTLFVCILKKWWDIINNYGNDDWNNNFKLYRIFLAFITKSITNVHCSVRRRFSNNWKLVKDTFHIFVSTYLLSITSSFLLHKYQK